MPEIRETRSLKLTLKRHPLVAHGYALSFHPKVRSNIRFISLLSGGPFLGDGNDFYHCSCSRNLFWRAKHQRFQIAAMKDSWYLCRALIIDLQICSAVRYHSTQLQIWMEDQQILNENVSENWKKRIAGNNHSLSLTYIFIKGMSFSFNFAYSFPFSVSQNKKEPEGIETLSNSIKDCYYSRHAWINQK